MLKNFKSKFLNQKGFTLVEILVVIVIIGILFTVILPRIDFASDKARQTGVKTDFRTFATASEQYLRETAGRNMNYDGLNSYLDKALTITEATKKSAKEDPWGAKYEVVLDATKGSIIVKSTGKGKSNPDFLEASYYYKGSIDMCTAGLGAGDIQLQTFTLKTTPIPAANFGTSNFCGNEVTGLK